MSTLMTERKVRILFFVLGLTVGIIMGATVVRVYSDKVNAETSVSKNFVSRLFGNIIGLVYKPKQAKIDTLPIVTSKNIVTYNSANDTTSDGTESNVDENSKNLNPNDSIQEPSKLEKSEENIVVLSDKLIASTRLQIIESESTIILNKKDSALVKGGKSNTQKQVSIYAIEFWQSPLNYRGYKTQKNKIVLYGINKEEPLKLLRINEKLYLKFQNQYSIIDNRSDFHSFEKVQDQQIILQLNALK
jgi:hypothetical protein